jgi:hypothetical protein
MNYLTHAEKHVSIRDVKQTQLAWQLNGGITQVVDTFVLIK